MLLSSIILFGLKWNGTLEAIYFNNAGDLYHSGSVLETGKLLPKIRD
jgi:hypothetical protein